MKKKILFTGAHHNSALALLDWLQKNNNDLEFVWVGKKFIPGSDSALTAEFKEVSARNLKFYNISAGKLYRFTNPKYFLPFLKNLLLIPIGFAVAFNIIRKEKPDLIVSFGGYIAVPIVVVGKLFNIKSITHEQTVSVGLANQLIYVLVDKIYTAWPIYNYPADYRSKMVEIGLPLGQKFLNQIHSQEKYKFDNSNPVIYVTGGKNGSQTINKFVYQSLDSLVDNFNFVWACGSLPGKYDFNYLINKIHEKNLSSKIILKEYFGEDEIGKVYNTADIVISRSGAHTTYELMYLKKPAILIPIPWASNNEQQRNAEMFKEKGLGYIASEDELSTEQLISLVVKLNKQRGKQESFNSDLTENSAADMGNAILQIIKKA